MKICLITFEYPPQTGGIATSSARIANYLASEGFEVHVFTVGSEKDNDFASSVKTVESNVEDGVNVHRYGPYSGGLTQCPHKELHLMHQFLDKLNKEHNFDVFHGFRTNGGGYLAVLMGLKNGKKSIVSLRGNDADVEIFNPRQLMFCKWLLEKADYVTFVSEESRKLLRKIADIRDKSSVILNSLDPKKFYYLPGGVDVKKSAGQITLSFVGSVRMKKGFSYLLAALKKLKEDGDYHLLVVGDFLEDEKIVFQEEILKHGLGNNVTLTGKVLHKHILNYIDKVDFFVLPSIAEGCPNALLEAMYCEKPCIATKVGAVEQMIKDGESGILIEPHSVDEIYNAVSVLAENKDLAKKLGKNAKAVVLNKFRPDIEIKSWMEVYRRVIE